VFFFYHNNNHNLTFPLIPPPFVSWILWFSSMYLHRRRTATINANSIGDTTEKSGPAALELARINVKQDGAPGVQAWGERSATE